ARPDPDRGLRLRRGHQLGTRGSARAPPAVEAGRERAQRLHRGGAGLRLPARQAERVVMAKIKVMIADDDQALAAALADTVGSAEDLEVVAVGHDTDAAVSAAAIH